MCWVCVLPECTRLAVDIDGQTLPADADLTECSYDWPLTSAAVQLRQQCARTVCLRGRNPYQNVYHIHNSQTLAFLRYCLPVVVC